MSLVSLMKVCHGGSPVVAMGFQGTPSSYVCDLYGIFNGSAPSCSPKSHLAWPKDGSRSCFQGGNSEIYGNLWKSMEIWEHQIVPDLDRCSDLQISCRVEVNIIYVVHCCSIARSFRLWVFGGVRNANIASSCHGYMDEDGILGCTSQSKGLPREHMLPINGPPYYENMSLHYIVSLHEKSGCCSRISWLKILYRIIKICIHIYIYRCVCVCAHIMQLFCVSWCSHLYK